MMVRDSIRKRAGVSLLEALTVMFGLAVALSLGATLLVAAMRADQVGAGNLRELNRRSGLADQFREDVARARSAPAQLAGWTAGESCLILRSADNAFVVYSSRNGQLERTERDGDRETRRPIPVGTEFLKLSFRQSHGERKLITLRLTEAPPVGVARSNDVSAYLGGDLR